MQRGTQGRDQWRGEVFGRVAAVLRQCIRSLSTSPSENRTQEESGPKGCQGAGCVGPTFGRYHGCGRELLSDIFDASRLQLTRNSQRSRKAMKFLSTS
ncbi:hypothetical protein PM082_023620 [Marasmius tenuissimus]|nr:hypothetical protein PM082_023620 [Marasmius tenuissimus]